ncbi:c-type cytochrome [bacterium SCSIO 12741]|nr:c-type cytochrome [bacterium SCSIO 12741]
MKFTSVILATLAIAFLASCGGDPEATAPKKEKMKLDSEPTTLPAAPPKPTTTLEKSDSKGVGPITEIQLEAIDQAMAAEGKEIYEQNCVACHKLDKKFIGPAISGVADRRTPEWIMNMILNPEQMVKEDPIAKQLLVEANMAPMANQGLSEDQARKILEYFRTL